MLSLNSVQLIGNLGRDGETRNLTQEHTATNFNVATTYSYKKDGSWVNDTTWHKCVVFNASDFVRAALVKGMPVFIQGRIQNRNYQNKDGQTVYITEIVADKVIPLSKVEYSDEVEKAPAAQETPDPFSDGSDLPF